MERAGNAVAAVQGTSSTDVQDLFRTLVARWRPASRIAGVIEEDHGLGERNCRAGRLRSIVDGASYPIFQDLGPGSTACHLDGAGAVSASEAVRHDIAAGCDLVVLSKFGKLEAGGAGLAPAFRAAIEAGVPVLTAVSPGFQAAWERFAAPYSIALPADPDRIEAWWQTASSARAGGRSAGRAASAPRPA
ncbi:MAG: DUF2478 domain-containing protein [Acetobacteraceae bacterium]|nr:DUF2478 domain-containing protein [Acetobacteraceae bacterium]